MRLLYVCADRGIPIGAPKGGSVHVAELLRALEAEGHATALLSCSPVHGRTPGRATFAALAPVPDRDVHDPRMRAAAADAIARFWPDVVYERYALHRPEAGEESARRGLPHVLEVNAPLVDEFRRFRGMPLDAAAERGERLAWRSADLVVVPSAALAKAVRAAGQERVLVVPNGVDPVLFAPRPNASALRRRLGFAGRFVVGWAGRLKPWHGLDTLIDAVASLPEALNPALLVIGDGPERAGMQQRAASLRVDVHFTGAVRHEQVPGYLRAADACVAGLLPDRALHYFSPIKAFEYLACGRPTVVAEAGELAALVAAGAALGYRPGEAAELASRLELIAGDAVVRERLGRAGRSFAETRTWRAAARAVAGAVERLPSFAVLSAGGSVRASLARRGP